MNRMTSIHSRPKVAIIGSGISGLASAYELADFADLTIYEADNRFGGHARTLIAGKNHDQPVDTGFIVFNYANYPHLTRMFKDLNVAVEKSNMSFGATINNGQVEYALRNLNTLFAQRKNLLKPQAYRMIRDILKFGKNAERLATDDKMTTGQLLDELDLGDWFVNYYLLPICGAIWSTPPSKIREFPAKALVQFFRNHALLEAGAQHQWWTVSNGSIEYVKKLVQHVESKGVTCLTSSPVYRVERHDNGVTIHSRGQVTRHFDQVIFACHSDDALNMLSDPTVQEVSALGNLQYQNNRAILHADARQMPTNKSCWSAWVYQSDGRGEEAQIGVTYWMNRLQNIDENDPLFVTLNPAKPIDERLIYDEYVFRHPVFDYNALQAQELLKSIQGHNHSYFAGAYLRHGFHEDGYASAVRVAEGLKSKWMTRV